MTYKHIKHIDQNKDLIIPCKKGDVKELQSLIPLDKLILRLNSHLTNSSMVKMATKCMRLV